MSETNHRKCACGCNAQPVCCLRSGRHFHSFNCMMRDSLNEASLAMMALIKTEQDAERLAIEFVDLLDDALTLLKGYNPTKWANATLAEMTTYVRELSSTRLDMFCDGGKND